MGSPAFFNYLNLMKKDTSYAKKMVNLGQRIFGDVSKQTNPTSLRVVRLLKRKPWHKNVEYNNEYYPRHMETYQLMYNLRSYGLFRDEHEDFKDEIIRQKALRGKKIYNWYERTGGVRKKK